MAFWRTLLRVEGLDDGMLFVVCLGVNSENWCTIPINIVDDPEIKAMLETNTEWPVRLIAKVEFDDAPHILKMYDFELAPEPDESILNIGQ